VERHCEHATREVEEVSDQIKDEETVELKTTYLSRDHLGRGEEVLSARNESAKRYSAVTVNPSHRKKRVTFAESNLSISV